MSKYLQLLKEKLDLLAGLVTDSQDFDRRFDMAVAEFKIFLNDAENHVPQELAETLRNKDLSNYGNQQSYIDDLRKAYKDYCEKIAKVGGTRDSLGNCKQEIKPQLQGMSIEDSTWFTNSGYKVHR